MDITLKKCHDGIHKYIVTIITKDRKKNIKFGAIGYSDFTIHKNEERKKNYIARHKTNENFAKSGVFSAGFWSRYILWNKPTISASIKDTERRFGISIKN